MELRAIDTRPALIDQVYARLVDAIADGSLPPGHRLRQEKLAADLGVSRQPVSHALAMLRSAGLAVEQGARGLVVAPIDPEHLFRLYEVRAALDGLAAALAARRAAAEPAFDTAALFEAVERGVAAENSGDIPAAVEWDLRFHAAINVLSGNAVLTEVSESQWPQIRRVMAVVKADRSLAGRIWQEHAAIAEAIRRGDDRAAEALARAHAEGAGAETRNRLINRALRAIDAQSEGRKTP